MRVIALQGSPRRDGHTAVLLESFLAPFRTAQTVRRVDVCYQHILPCRSCYACQSHGLCVGEDDMRQLYTHLAEDEIVVIASPIYFWGVTAQLKAVIDRCQLFWTHPKRRITSRVGVLLLTAGAPDGPGTGVSTTAAQVRIFLTCLGAPLKHVFAATDTDAVPAREQHGLLTEVAAAARQLAEAAKGGN